MYEFRFKLVACQLAATVVVAVAIVTLAYLFPNW